jgi:hypothetical protein
MKFLDDNDVKNVVLIVTDTHYPAIINKAILYHENKKIKNSILVKFRITSKLAVTSPTQNQMAYALTFKSTENVRQTAATNSTSPLLELPDNNIYTMAGTSFS